MKTSLHTGTTYLLIVSGIGDLNGVTYLIAQK